jgi:hypothetical protein
MIRNLTVTLLFAIIMTPLMIFPQNINKMITDPKKGTEILIGNCNRTGLKSGDFGLIFKEKYKNYKPDMTVVHQLSPLKSGVDILVVLGTWCSDSQEQVPAFFKILDMIRFDKKMVQIICVDSNKKAGEVDLTNYNIEKVPTFIIYKKGREVGRIIETPYATLEKDLLMFFSDN